MPDSFFGKRRDRDREQNADPLGDGAYAAGRLADGPSHPSDPHPLPQPKDEADIGGSDVRTDPGRPLFEDRLGTEKVRLDITGRERLGVPYQYRPILEPDGGPVARRHGVLDGIPVCDRPHAGVPGPAPIRTDHGFHEDGDASIRLTAASPKGRRSIEGDERLWTNIGKRTKRQAKLPGTRMG